MRRITILLAGTAIAFGMGAVALAQTGPTTKGPNPAERFRAQFLERLDTDKDGKVTKAEFLASYTARFKAADKDGDGFLTKEEFAAYGDQRRGEFVDRIFARLDKNGDGKLAADEIAHRGGKRGDRAGRRGRHGLNFDRADAAKKGFLTQEDLVKFRSERMEARLKKRFEALDTNRDGKLTADELGDRRGRFAMRADADKNGAVTFEEFAARSRQFLVRRVEVEFKAFDANGDGKLTKAEVDAARGKPMLLLIADANHDGVVTKEELAKAFAGRGATARDRMFARLDADKDGKISAAEYQASGEQRFARLDRNKDGVITADEIGRRGRHGDRRRDRHGDR
ncbi:MAG: EF-hand domain-containing protein [Rhodospirillaceae bacterium]|nr:EF-hand domain-containing protein [Rhodospirillaceae bacterium]